MKKFKIVYEAVLPAEHLSPYDVECPVVNKQIEQGWSVVNTFRFNSSRIAFVMEKEIHDVNIQ